MNIVTSKYTKLNFGVQMTGIDNEKRSSRRMLLEEKLDKILPVAESLIAKYGFEFTVKEVIEQSGLPKQTFMNTIPNKESLIVYLGIKAINLLMTYDGRGAKYSDKSRLMLLGSFIGYLIFTKLHPALHKCIYEANSFRSKDAIDKQLEQVLNLKNHEIITRMQKYIDKGLYDQDLVLPERLTTFDVAFYLWYGHYGVFNQSYNSQDNVVNSLIKYKIYVRGLLNAWGWQPVSPEVNDKASEEIVATIFLEEYKKLGSLNVRL